MGDSRVWDLFVPIESPGARERAVDRRDIDVGHRSDRLGGPPVQIARVEEGAVPPESIRDGVGVRATMRDGPRRVMPSVRSTAEPGSTGVSVMWS